MKPSFSSLLAILLPDLRGGGAERVSVDLARAFVEAGHEVELVLMSAVGDLLTEAKRDFSVVSLDADRTRKLPQKLANYLRTRRPSALIANMWPLTSAAVLGRALSRQPCRLLLVEHNTLSQQYASWGAIHKFAMRASMTATHRWADHVAAVSEGVASDIAQLSGLNTNRVSVLHNPIPQRPVPDSVALAEADKIWSCCPGKRILNVGSLKDQKNHPLLLRAFARIADTNARLMLVGTGQGEASLRTLAAELRIADRVIFAGFRSDPTPFYRTADLFVLSSDYEGFGNVIVEAMACGTPVVSTNCPSGPAEILENGRYGRLVPVNDPAALATAMEASLAETPDRVALQQRAAEFSPAVAARQYLDLLGMS